MMGPGSAAHRKRRCAASGAREESTMSPYPPVISGTRIGHVHLKVADLERALGFYRDVLGFKVQQRRGNGAAFVAADDYRRRIGLNPGRAGRPSAAAGHHRPLSHRDPVPDAAGAGRGAASGAERGHSARRRQRPRRQRGAVSARPRSERCRALLGPPEGGWPREADGALAMFTKRLDVEDLLRQRVA